MSNLIVTPQIVRRIEDNLRYILVNSWARRQQNLWWRRVMRTRTSSTKRELLQWMLETAKIRPLDNGGRYSFEDLTEIYWEIENEKFGDALSLTADEIADALESPAVSGGPLDRANAWARQIGSYGAYWPQERAAYLLKNGKTLTCYDNGAFFRENHPINPYIGTDSGTFTNLFLGYEFSPNNLAAITAYIRDIPGPDGVPRHLVPRIVAGGSYYQFAFNQVLNAEWYTDPRGTGGASGSNVIKLSYNYEAPIVAPELSEPGNPWYLFCELVEDDELGPLIYQERAPFTMNSYSPMSDVDLGLRDAFEWQFQGRNAASYGHPFLAFRIETTGERNLPEQYEALADPEP